MPATEFCQNLRDHGIATHVAYMQSIHRQRDGSYIRQVPLCDRCAEGVSVIGYQTEKIETGEQDG